MVNESHPDEEGIISVVDNGIETAINHLESESAETSWTSDDAIIFKCDMTSVAYFG